MVDQDNEGILVIVAGLNRTGTNSLQFALQRLLNGKCYHLLDILERPRDVYFWRRACEEDISDDEFRHFFRDFKAVLDSPAAAFYERLMEVYPDAKVILTMRDPEEWYRSFRATLVDSFENDKSLIHRFYTKTGLVAGIPDTLKCLWRETFGPDFDLNSEESMIRCFNNHIKKVREVVPPEKLLEFRATDGWEPLCRFLEKPIPSEPYPHVNTTKDINGLIHRVWVMHAVVCGTAVLALSGIGFLCGRYLVRKFDVMSFLGSFLV